MGKIIGEQFDKYVKEQINLRQKAHGSGVSKARTDKELIYLNSKTAWAKLASGVRITDERLTVEKMKLEYFGDLLAKKHVLFGGTSTLEGTILKQRGSQTDNIFGSKWGTYNVNPSISPSNSLTSEFGLVPMPGIESVEVKCLNRGSIKNSTVKIKCYSPEQFQVLDLLYLRIGYTVFLEWGTSLYFSGEDTLSTMGYTLIEDEHGFFNDKWRDSSYTQFLPKLEATRKDKKGNYDGLLAKVVNFSWEFDQDGAYDITLELISLGDVVESLKMNIAPSLEISTFVKAAYFLYNGNDATANDKDIQPSPANNIISSYLFIQKLYLDKKANSGDERIANREVTIRAGGDILNLGGTFITPPIDSIIKLAPYIATSEGFDTEEPALSWGNTNLTGYDYAEKYANVHYADTPKWGIYRDPRKDNKYFVIYKIFPLINPGDVNDDVGKKEVVYLSYNDYVDDGDIINDAGFYMRFGHLLEYINNYVITKIDNENKTPLIKIDTAMWSNKMYTLPYQVSLDPRVCIVNPKDQINTKEFFPELIDWKNPTKNYAWTMNIYLSHNQIISSLNSNTDEKGNTSLFDFLSSICTALNKALGGINNLEPFIDEVDHTLYIVDGSYYETKPDGYVLGLFGYNPSNSNQSNFVRNFNLKTEITNDFATMASVGATAAGYVKGTENTMFSKWNKGLLDSWKEKLIPAAQSTSTSGSSTEDEPNILYVKDFWNQRYSAFGYTLADLARDITTSDQAGLNDEIIDNNIEIVTEYYRYIQNKIAISTEGKYASPTNGFIPINLQLTMDGISGIKIYNEINVDTRFLPNNYPDNLRFIIKGVNHKLSDSDWETTIETMVIAKTEDKHKPSYEETRVIMKDDIAATNIEIVEAAIASSASSTAPSSRGNADTSGAGSADGKSTLGLTGINTPQSNLAKNAKSKEQIDEIVKNSGTTSTIRKRIVEIALSYVGANEVKGNNKGWHNAQYQEKFVNSRPKWSKTQPWCAWFCQVVYREAYTTGNALVPSVDGLTYADFYKETWKTYFKNGAKIGSSSQSPTKFDNYFTIGQAKSGTKVLKPGDLVHYKNPNSYTGHIEIVTEVFLDGRKLKGFNVVSGNSSASNPRDGGLTRYGKQSYKMNHPKLKGFSSPITP